jgi:hypothetical protein
LETVIVKDVDGPNASGWYEVALEDGRKASTKNEEMAKTAFQSRGSEVPAEISERVNGKFVNIYLNEIDGIKDAPRRGRKPAATASPAPRGGKSPEEQERIARQWAYGRSVELLVGSGAEFVFPLDSATKSAIADEAAWLLGSTKE